MYIRTEPRHNTAMTMHRLFNYGALLAGVLLAHAAAADDFTARAIAGRAASATAAGSKFDQSLIPMLGKFADACDPPGTSLPATELGAVDIIGDITPAGMLLNIAERPVTPVSSCFAARLVQTHFDPPPHAGTNYPLFVHLTVTN